MTDTITKAYADWLAVHKLLVEAEQQLRMLPVSSDSKVREAAHQRVEQLRAESDSLLAVAQQAVRAYEAKNRPR